MIDNRGSTDKEFSPITDVESEGMLKVVRDGKVVYDYTPKEKPATT